ncbi:hypothetical protein MAR_037615 [Mya arenaria]|uniref:DDE Tnp4 domain-containing protein n=1 Tax=Mya arenaria TaxID=6604 RepID=A0ABY7FT92_MYAAR|nr:hypothetical protein MAR_037615 [Mya arenaria]
MADKGFNIQGECASRNISLYVPPGRRGTFQMPMIRRLKTFRILANELPISIVSHIDDILVVCSALCNLKPPICKT